MLREKSQKRVGTGWDLCCKGGRPLVEFEPGMYSRCVRSESYLSSLERYASGAAEDSDGRHYDVHHVGFPHTSTL